MKMCGQENWIFWYNIIVSLATNGSSSVSKRTKVWCRTSDILNHVAGQYMCSVTKGVQLQGFIKMDPLLKQSGVARLSKFTPGKQHEFMMGKTNYLKCLKWAQWDTFFFFHI